MNRSFIHSHSLFQPVSFLGYIAICSYFFSQKSWEIEERLCLEVWLYHLKMVNKMQYVFIYLHVMYAYISGNP